jgi:hypothetical protein
MTPGDRPGRIQPTLRDGRAPVITGGSTSLGVFQDDLADRTAPKRPAVRRTDPWSPGDGDREAVTNRDLNVNANPWCTAVGAGQEGKDLADGAVPGCRSRGAVAAAVLVLDDVPGLGAIGNDAVGGALGDAPSRPRCSAAARSAVGDAQQ